MWNDEITLIGFKITGKDKLKQDLTEKVKTTIFCKKKSITRSEFYQANQAGIRPNLMLTFTILNTTIKNSLNLAIRNTGF